MIRNIIYEMIQGNFSFAILIVGILQLLEMRKKKTNRLLQKLENDLEQQNETLKYIIELLENKNGKRKDT